MMSFTIKVLKKSTAFLILSFCIGCFGSSDSNDLILSQRDNGPFANPGAMFQSVIGQEVRVFHQADQSFQEPLQVQLISKNENDTDGEVFAVSHFFIDQDLAFRVPPKIPAGLTTLKIIDPAANILTGTFDIRRLGVIANRGNGKLLIFDIHNPEATQEIELDSQGERPEDVTISPDGRFAHIVLAQNPTTLTLDLTLNPPEIVSDHFSNNQSATSLKLLPDLFMAFAPNSGDLDAPGDSLDVFSLKPNGILSEHITNVPVGIQSQSMPYEIAPFISKEKDEAFALLSNRNDGSLSFIQLNACMARIEADCLDIENIDLGLSEPTGVDIHPDGNFALVSDYATDKIHVFQITDQDLEISESLDLGGGDQGPVALRISPGGGRALVLNEKSSQMVILDLTQGSPIIFDTLNLEGQSPKKISFSHGGKTAWVTFSGSNEVRYLNLGLYIPELSEPLNISGLNNPRGIAVQP